jgi:Peptidase family M28
VKRFSLLLISLCLLLLLLPAAAQAMTFDQAVNRLVKSGWAKKMEYKCVSFKDSSLGYRLAGTAADDACARWIASEMRAMGLASVKLEAVPVDEWDFDSASVKVSGLGYPSPVTYKASGFAGTIPTPMGGVTGEVVYVKDVDLVNGPWSGSAGAFDAVGDVAGKVVIIDETTSLWWWSWPVMEAGLRDASAVILTYNPDWPWYWGLPNALGSFEVEADLSSPPLVWISWKNGDALKAALASGTVTATVKNNATLHLAGDGGTAYNVVGKIPGTTNKNEYVVFGSHHDAFFTGALDNASAVVNELVIAKAMKMSHFTPKRTIVFLSFTGEEYGYTNACYDWCVGAWHFITKRHPGWAGKIAGMLNSELLGYKKGNLWMLASPEVQPMLTQRLAAATDLTLTKNSTPAQIIGGPWCWNDQWPFTAAGVPSVSFWSQDNDYSGVFTATMYHTQYDTPSLIDWNFFGDIAKFQFRVTKKFDRGVLPYTLGEQPAQLQAALDAQIGGPTGPTVAEAIESSIDPSVYDDFTAALARFDVVSHRFDSLAAAGDLPVANRPFINARLMEIEKLVNSNFTAIDWLDSTVYPFDQVVRDITHMKNAYAALDVADPDYDTAAAEVGAVGLMWYGTNFSGPVFKRELRYHQDSFYRIGFAGQGHLATYQNLMPDYNAILAGNAAGAMDLLDGKIAFQESDLEARIVDMSTVLREASDQIEDLFPIMAEVD